MGFSSAWPDFDELGRSKTVYIFAGDVSSLRPLQAIRPMQLSSQSREDLFFSIVLLAKSQGVIKCFHDVMFM